jgi:hypothetical protein
MDTGIVSASAVRMARLDMEVIPYFPEVSLVLGLMGIKARIHGSDDLCWKLLYRAPDPSDDGKRYA